MKRVRKQKRSETFGQAVIDSLNEVLEITDRGEPITMRRVKLTLEPRQFTREQIRELRVDKLRVSQAIFAQLMGVSVKLIEAWEGGRNIPSGPVRRLLEEIDRNPQAFLKRYIRDSAA